MYLARTSGQFRHLFDHTKETIVYKKCMWCLTYVPFSMYNLSIGIKLNDYIYRVGRENHSSSKGNSEHKNVIELFIGVDITKNKKTC